MKNQVIPEKDKFQHGHRRNEIGDYHDPRYPKCSSKTSTMVPDSPTVQRKYGGGALAPPDTSSTENEEMSTHESEDELLGHVESTPINMDTPNMGEEQPTNEISMRQMEEGEATNRMLDFGDDFIK